jgi:phytoene synthase
MSAADSRMTNLRSTNFYYSFVFLPREKRQAIEAVYRFARRGDDISDGGLPHEQARQEILCYRQALEACFAGQASLLRDPDLRALSASIQRFKIPRQPFEDLISGLEMDLNGTTYETTEDLERYCYRVASTIGLISIEIFGYRDLRAREYAVKLGLALQVVNILRDVQSDAYRGRIYLPREDLERFGVRPEDLRAGAYTGPFKELMRFECDRARRYFGIARQLLPPGDRRSLVAAEIMAAIYWRILARIQERGYNVFGDRVRISRARKFWTALSVYLGAEAYQ